jgi:ribosomal protein S18 acetylase RimI-like enzyme
MGARSAASPPHVPLTRAEMSEVFVYDIAVVSDYQRQGIGRTLRLLTPSFLFR